MRDPSARSRSRAPHRVGDHGYVTGPASWSASSTERRPSRPTICRQFGAIRGPGAACRDDREPSIGDAGPPRANHPYAAPNCSICGWPRWQTAQSGARPGTGCKNRTVDDDAFWGLIEDATRSTCEETAVALQGRLELLPIQSVGDFCDHFEAIMTALNTWDLWGVAYILKRGCSDDSFMDFRGWVISQGRAATELAIADAESFGLSIDPAQRDWPSLWCEHLLYAPHEAYKALTGERSPPRDPDAPRGLVPTGEDWEETTEGLTSRFPRLMDRYKHEWT